MPAAILTINRSSTQAARRRKAEHAVASASHGQATSGLWTPPLKWRRALGLVLAS